DVQAPNGVPQARLNVIQINLKFSLMKEVTLSRRKKKLKALEHEAANQDTARPTANDGLEAHKVQFKSRTVKARVLYDRSQPIQKDSTGSRKSPLAWEDEMIEEEDNLFLSCEKPT